ncbi:exonuclease subunit SbcC [Geminocystis sp. GBBB08]|uniref:exonuclease subunit SbcC n=1 Tax=Geminocystis sp. GBBB08 TaxID=2604140 RepID=UPI0027E22964|nr:exonuclease subunit SbcC [Geminocystis sp. GBBB08]MBL1210945.1 exonuclease subunit SbcC [Geminocystis sp. GBBB08]
MIPRQLNLQNFLSYRQAKLDFTGLHTACICGANGSGKSSLLEAITWTIWGKTRTATEDDVIHLGEKNTRVDFEFIYKEEFYRIIRTRQRKGSGTLDFQIINNNRYKSLSGKNVSETQKEIIKCLKIDYDTFLNSAYLRQGRADEFMLRKPAERKKILADLLKLDQYEILAEESKDLAKQYKVRIEDISQQLEDIENKLEGKEAIKLDLDNTKKDLKYFQDLEAEKLTKLETIKSLHNQRETWEKRLIWQGHQLDNILRTIQQLEIEKVNLETEINKLAIILDKEENIVYNYEQLQNLKEEDKELSQKFATYQQLLETKQKLVQQLREESNNLILGIQREKTNLENLLKQETELEKTVSKSHELTSDLEKLNLLRQRLKELDEIQLQITPYLQQQQTIKTELEREKARLQVKLEQLQEKELAIQETLAQVPIKRQQFFSLEKQLEIIENNKNYQKRIQEKGEEKKGFIQRYIDKQENLAKQIVKLHNKLEMLNQENAICPLCERELDENHLRHVITKTEEEEKQIKSESWRYEIEKVNCERELEKLRIEYRKLNEELANENSLKQDYAKLENQLYLTEDIYNQQEEIQQQKAELMTLLDSENYAQSLQSELANIEQKILQLNYNEKDHALLRQEESSLRKVEFQQLKIKDAQKELNKLLKRKPELESKIQQLEIELKTLTENSQIQLAINKIESEIKIVNYDSNYHNNVRQNLRDLQDWQTQYLELQQAKKQYPQLTKKCHQLITNIENYQQEKIIGEEELNTINQQLSSLTDYTAELNNLTNECSQYRNNINNLLTKKGGLEQYLTNIKDRENERKKLEETLQETQKNYRIYQELSIAFGKNGIQSLMIENILPELETEANNILSRLTNSQLHVQFLTQKPKSSRSKSSSSQFKDTLEIIISDTQGTRSYETYSGGEAFRINFAIRLALSRILAQRSGTALQLLIIDEGFGTQDSEGCDRLIAALNAIAEDFACILTVTHMPQFKEAFQTRI